MKEKTPAGLLSDAAEHLRRTTQMKRKASSFPWGFFTVAAKKDTMKLQIIVGRITRQNLLPYSLRWFPVAGSFQLIKMGSQIRM
jgi:hypothetical protein